MPSKVLFTAVKNEGPFLLEWIAYHKAIGFEKIFIVSNDSTDGTTELLDVLHDAGVIIHAYHSVLPHESPHGKAADIANKSGLFGDGDWVIWLDADEFLNIKVGHGKVEDLIETIGARQGMLINWHVFGDSGHVTFPGRFISKDFEKSDRRDYKRNKRIKTFIRWREGNVEYTLNPHRPYLNPEAKYACSDFLNGNGRAISSIDQGHKDWLEASDKRLALSVFAVPPEDYGWEVAQINHYSVRTPDVYALKKYRGRSHPKINRDGSPNKERHNDDFFRTFNTNYIIDTSILRFENDTYAGIQALKKIAGVLEAQENTMSRTSAAIAELQRSDNFSSNGEASGLSVATITNAPPRKLTCAK